MDQKFKQLVEDSKRVLITSHYTPDPDAVISSLLLAAFIRTNYPNKSVRVLLEDQPRQDLHDITDYQTIEFRPLLEGIDAYKPDLFIMTDVDSISRLTHANTSDDVWLWIRNHNVKTAAVNHHDPGDKDASLDAYVNTRTMAAAEEVYRLCCKRLKMKEPDGYDFPILLAIVDDSNRFRYHITPHYRRTFELVSDLLDAGERIERVSAKIDRYPEESLKIIAELAQNLCHEDDYTYSFIRDDVAKAFVAAGWEPSYYRQAGRWFVDQFIPFTDNRTWGFIVVPDPQGPKGSYGVSLRAVAETFNLLPLAKTMGGGGHPYGCGASVRADSAEKAVAIVQKAIEDFKRQCA